MESFIQKQEKLLEAVPSKAPGGEGGREAKGVSVQEETDGQGTWKQGTRLDTDSGEFSPSVSAAAPASASSVCKVFVMRIWPSAC